MRISQVSRPGVFLDRDGVIVDAVFYPETGKWEAPTDRLHAFATWCRRRVRELQGLAPVLVSN
jgi:hypothetical protein